MKPFAGIAFFTLIALIFIVKPVYAAPSAEGAKALQSSLQEVLDIQKSINETYGSVLVVYEGPLQVVPHNAYYTVTLPRILLKNKLPEDKSIVDLGVVTMNAVEGDKAGLWKMTITMPSVLTVTQENTTPLTLNIGSQSAAGLFNQNLGYFTKLDVLLADITAKDGGHDLGLKIGKINLNLNLDEAPDGRLTGPGQLSVENFNFADEFSTISLGKFATTMSVDKFKPVPMREYKDKILAHKAVFDSLAKLETDENAVIDSAGVLSMIMDIYSFSADDFAFQYGIENLSMDTLPSPDDSAQPLAANESEHFKIAKAHMGFGAKDMESPAGGFSVDMGFSGVSLTPVDPEYDGIMPSDMNIDLKAEKLPVKMLAELLTNTAGAAMQNPDMAALAGLGLMAKLPALLSQAGSEMIIGKNYIKGPGYNAEVQGKIVTDLTALLSFTAKLNGLFEGLDGLQAKMQKNASNPDLPNAQDYADFSVTLEDIKSYGKKSGSSYTYDIELNKQGQLMINGKEMTMMPEEAPPVMPAIPPQGAEQPQKL